MGIPVPREADIQRLCIDWLRSQGFVAIRTNSAAMKIDGRFIRANSEPGCSDVLCCAPDGAFLAIEFKRPGGNATEKQLSFLAAVTKRNGLALVVSSLDQLVHALKLEGYEV